MRPKGNGLSVALWRGEQCVYDAEFQSGILQTVHYCTKAVLKQLRISLYPLSVCRGQKEGIAVVYILKTDCSVSCAVQSFFLQYTAWVNSLDFPFCYAVKKSFISQNKSIWGPLELVEKLCSESSDIATSVRDMPGLKYVCQLLLWARDCSSCQASTDLLNYASLQMCLLSVINSHTTPSMRRPILCLFLIFHLVQDRTWASSSLAALGPYAEKGGGLHESPHRQKRSSWVSCDASWLTFFLWLFNQVSFVIWTLKDLYSCIYIKINVSQYYIFFPFLCQRFLWTWSTNARRRRDDNRGYAGGTECHWCQPLCERGRSRLPGEANWFPTLECYYNSLPCLWVWSSDRHTFTATDVWPSAPP